MIKHGVQVCSISFLPCLLWPKIGGMSPTCSQNDRKMTLQAIKLYMQEKCTLDIDDAEVYLIPQKEVQLKTSNWEGEQDNYGAFR